MGKILINCTTACIMQALTLYCVCIKLTNYISILGKPSDTQIGNSSAVIKEFKLAYSPQNELFKNMLRDVEKSLNLTESIGVDTPTELEAVVATKQLIAGVQFDHLAVII